MSAAEDVRLTISHCRAMLSAGDRVVCVRPAYQSLYEHALSLGCEVSFWDCKLSENGNLHYNVRPHHRTLQTESCARLPMSYYEQDDASSPKHSSIISGLLQTVRALLSDCADAIHLAQTKLTWCPVHLKDLDIVQAPCKHDNGPQNACCWGLHYGTFGLL